MLGLKPYYINISIIMKPTDSATQGQSNPRKIRLNEAFGPLFPTKKVIFRGLGLKILESDYRKPSPAEVSAYTLLILGAVEGMSRHALKGRIVQENIRVVRSRSNGPRQRNTKYRTKTRFLGRENKACLYRGSRKSIS